MIWINFAGFISTSWGILITCLVCFRMKRFKCPLCPLSYFLPFFLTEQMRRTKCLLFYKCSLKMFARYPEANYNRSCKDLPNTSFFSTSVGIHFVDSHFVHCIFIWKCQRTHTLLDPSPAKSLYRASLWLQVDFTKGYLWYVHDIN